LLTFQIALQIAALILDNRERRASRLQVLSQNLRVASTVAMRSERRNVDGTLTEGYRYPGKRNPMLFGSGQVPSGRSCISTTQ